MVVTLVIMYTDRPTSYYHYINIVTLNILHFERLIEVYFGIKYKKGSLQRQSNSYDFGVFYHCL